MPCLVRSNSRKFSFIRETSAVYGQNFFSRLVSGFMYANFVLRRCGSLPVDENELFENKIADMPHKHEFSNINTLDRSRKTQFATIKLTRQRKPHFAAIRARNDLLK